MHWPSPLKAMWSINKDRVFPVFGYQINDKTLALQQKMFGGRLAAFPCPDWGMFYIGTAFSLPPSLHPSLHTHLQEVPVFLLNHLFHWLSLHPPSGGNGSLRYEQRLQEICSFPENACGAKCWLYNFFMLVSDEGVWIGNFLLAGRKKQSWA